MILFEKSMQIKIVFSKICSENPWFQIRQIRQKFPDWIPGTRARYIVTRYIVAHPAGSLLAGSCDAACIS